MNIENKENLAPHTNLDVMELKNEIELTRNEMLSRQRLVANGRADVEREQLAIKKGQREMKYLERMIVKGCLELEIVTEAFQKTDSNYKSKFDIFKKYETQTLLLERLDLQQDVLTKQTEHLDQIYNCLTNECNSLENEINEEFKMPDDGEYQDIKKKLTKLEINLKQLQIKTSSLEGELLRKTEECLALYSLYNDITSKTG